MISSLTFLCVHVGVFVPKPPMRSKERSAGVNMQFIRLTVRMLDYSIRNCSIGSLISRDIFRMISQDTFIRQFAFVSSASSELAEPVEERSNNLSVSKVAI